MKKNRSTKRALLMSALSMVLCLSMLVGSTFAWFTDSVTSSGNIIKSGTLDVEMYWADGKTDPKNTTWTDASQGAIFDYDNWEPGYVDVKHIQIKNTGSLALKYQVSIVPTGEVSKLAEVIDVYYADPAVQVADRSVLAQVPALSTLDKAIGGMSATASGELAAGASDTITLALKMQESAGNEYQNLAIGSDFSVVLMATQLTAETDSFDDQYDFDATYTAEIDQLKAKLAAAQSGETVEYALTHDAYIDSKIEVPNGVTLVLNGNGHQAIVNTAYPFYVHNANIQMNDLTITGKATYAIFTKGAIWDYNGNNATVNASFNNVTVDLDKADNYPVVFNGIGEITMTDCTITGAGLSAEGDYRNGTHIFAGAEINLTVYGGTIGGVLMNANNVHNSTLTLNNGAVVDKLILAGDQTKSAELVNNNGTVNELFRQADM